MLWPFLKKICSKIYLSLAMMGVFLRLSRLGDLYRWIQHNESLKTYIHTPYGLCRKKFLLFYKKQKKVFIQEWNFSSPYYMKADPPETVKIIFWVAASFFIAFILWASLFKIDEFVHAPGEVETSLDEKIMRHLEGGVIESIRVKEGQFVNKGDVLLTLKDRPIKASKDDNTYKYYANLGHVERLKALIAHQQQLTLSKPIESYSKKLATEIRGAFNTAIESLNNQKDIYQKQKNTKELELDEMIEREKNLKEAVKLAEDEVEHLEPLTQKKLFPKTQFIRSQKDLLDKKTQYESAVLNIPKLKSEIAELEERLEQVAYDFQQKALDELKQRDADLGTVSARLEADTDRFERLRLVSPIAGIVKTLHVKTVGSALSSAQDAITIVPFQDDLVVIGKVDPKDIGFVSVGNKVNTKITAFDYSIFGSLEGKVTQISPDTFLNEDKNPYFKVKVQCARNYFSHNGKKLFISPGMTSQLDILTGQKSVMHYILKPVIKTFSEALTEQ